MALSLNFTAPLKQDPESQQRLQRLEAVFSEMQPTIDAAFAKSELVHFARVLVIDNKYIQVLTEFDGDPMQYTEFFRVELPEIFAYIFSLMEGAPPWEEIDNPNDFYEYAQSLNRKALGVSPDVGYDHGYLYSAFGDVTVREIKKQLSSSLSLAR